MTRQGRGFRQGGARRCGTAAAVLALLAGLALAVAAPGAAYSGMPIESAPDVSELTVSAVPLIEPLKAALPATCAPFVSHVATFSLTVS